MRQLAWHAMYQLPPPSKVTYTKTFSVHVKSPKKSIYSADIEEQLKENHRLAVKERKKMETCVREGKPYTADNSYDRCKSHLKIWNACMKKSRDELRISVLPSKTSALYKKLLEKARSYYALERPR